MVREILKIRTDNGLGDNNPAFKDIELTDYSAKFPRMGMPSLSASLKWATPLDDEWTRREYVTLRGERFYIRHTPSGKKDNQDSRYNHEIEFTSEFAEILGNIYFEDAVPSYASTYDKPCSNSSKFTFYGTIAELVDRLNCAFLKAGIGDSRLETKTDLIATDTVFNDGYCVMLDQLGAGTVYDPYKTYEFSFEDKSLWEAITEGFNKTEIPFERRGRKIIFGAIPNVVAHKFEYGHDNELLSIYHKNANAKVINRVTMLGSSENIPYYYPNETEYGHISIVADESNTVLNSSMISVRSFSKLLAKVREGDYIRLRKSTASESVVSVDNSKFYTGFFHIDELTQSSPDQIHTYPFNNTTYNENIFYIRTTFSIGKATEAEFTNMTGCIWSTNQGTAAVSNLIPSVGVARLCRIGENNTKTNITSQVSRKPNGTYSLGSLMAGNYEIIFSIPFKRYYQEDMFFMVRSVRIISAEQKTYYWEVGDKQYNGLSQLGIILNATVNNNMVGDGFKWIGTNRMPFQTNLVPPKYRNTLGDERFYNALNSPYTEEYATEHPDAYLDPDNIDPATHLPKPYVFPNPFIEGSPSEYIHRNEEIKPTIEGVINAVQRRDTNGDLMFDENGNPIYQLLGEIADIAYDADDNDSLKAESTEDGDKNDTLKYEHSFFYIKLNIFNGTYGFDLFAHASQTDAMTIQMRDGSCNGCKFKVQSVKFTDSDGFEVYKNPVIVKDGVAVGVIGEEGIKESDLDPTQQNTQTHSIWICVQKDASTLGVLMPNQSGNFKPKVGDKFNIINIDLPQAYILAAEKRLEEEGIRFMSDNNEEKFTFDIQASRIFFAEHPEVLAQLDEYSKIKVKYNGKEYEQYVNQLTIDCKDSEALPNIGIDLTDELSVGASFVDKVAERASSLISNAFSMGGALGTGGLSTRLADQRYLNKTDSDRSKGLIASDVGFEVGDFVSGGSGGIFYQDPETGQTYIEADKLKIRMKAIFEELEIAKVSTIGGKFIITPGGGINISFVEERTNSYRCYFKSKEENEKAECRMVVGDQVQCMEFSVGEGQYKNVATRYYWRLVTAVNNDESYIELSKTDRDNAYDIPSDAPQAGDTIVQLGNRNDDTRQSAIILSTIDAFAPCVTLYNGIDHYSLDGKEVVEYGVDKTKNPPEPFFNCYGRFYFGPRSRASFLEFNPTTMMLEYKGILHIDSKIGDKTIENYVKGIIPLDEYDYLKQALWQDTTITNGLILTSAVSLGYKDNDGVRHTTAGMSGIYNHPKSIASWWGGDMVDKYYQNKTVQNILTVEPRPTELTTGYAQALIRMDGSGYFAGGNIRWTESGAMTFGSGIVIDLGGGKSSTFEGIGNSLSSLTLLLDKFAQAFVPIVIENGQKKETNWGSITSIDDLYAIKAKKGFYSDSFISAHGSNPDGSSGGGSGFGLMRTWDNEQKDNENTTKALGANLGWELKQAIDNLPTTSVNPFGLTIQKNGTTLGSYDGSESKTIDISDVASASTLSNHTDNSTIHVTPTDKALWNQTATNLSAILGSNTDNVINKYEEIVAFLDTYTEADTLAGLLSNKADKTTKISAGTGLTGGGTLAADRTLSLATSGVTAGIYFKTTVDTYGRVTAGSNPTTLAGFGITDAYTKTDADTRYVNVSGDTMTGALTLPRLNIVGSVSSNSYLTSDSPTNMYVNVGGKALMTFDGSSPAVRSGTSQAGNISLGTSAVRWANLYSVLGNFSGQVTAQSLKIGDCEITWDATNGGLKFSKGIYSEGFVSAKGANSSGGSSGGSSFGRLDNWSNYNPNGTDALSATLGFELKTRIDTLEGLNYLNDLTIAVTGSGNAVTSVSQSNDKKTLTFTKGTTFLTSEALAPYLKIDGSNGTSAGVSALIRKLSEASSDVEDTTMFVTSHITPSDTNNLFYRRSALRLWSYIKGKADSVYLPLTGGTLTGALTIKTNTQPCLLLDSNTADKEVYLKILTNGVSKGALTWRNTSYGTCIYNYASTKYLGISDAGVPHFQGNTIWHSGNDGTGSGLDADLLDGLHKESFYATRQLFSKADYQHYVVLLWKADENGTHRINGKIYTKNSGSGRYQAANIDMWFSRWGTGSNYNQNLRFDTFGLSTAWKLVTCTYNGETWYALQHTNITSTTAFFIGTSDSIAFTAVHYYTSNTATVVNSSVNDSIVDKTSLLSKPYIGSNAYALVSDNVASATKLNDNTAFKAWGQTFFENGVPKTVSGNMTGVGSITASGSNEITMGAAAEPHFSVNNGTHKIGLLIGQGGENRGIYEWTTGITQWLLYFTNSKTILNYGNVGIGTTTPSYKLDVNGTTKVTKLIIGSITLEDVGGNLHINKGVYSDSFVSAHGANASGGASGGGVSYDRLNNWADYDTSKEGYVLSAKLGYDLYLNKLSSVTKAMVEDVLTGNITSHKHTVIIPTAETTGTTLGDFNTDGIRVYHQTADKGDGVSYCAILSVSGNSEHRYFQIIGGKGSSNLRWRTTNSNGTALGSVKTIVDSTNISSYAITSHQSLANYVDKTSAQEISGVKTFKNNVAFRSNTRGIIIYSDLRDKAGAIEIFGANGAWVANCMEFENNGDVTFRNKIIKSGGTSSQFLKADGSVDANSYLLSSSYTAADVLTKLKTVDGASSGLDADLLDGYHALSFPRVIQGMVNTTGTKYILLGSFDYENSSTTGGASFNIRGSIGRFGGVQKNVLDITVGNRDGVGFNGFISNMDSDDWDIGVNNARQIFLILKYQWLTYDIEVFSRQGTLVDGTTATPTDTNFVLLSASTLVNKFNNGKFLGSAASLTTARSLWGQSFDGTGDVSGRWELDGVANNSLSIYSETDYKAIQSWDSKPLMLNPLGNNVAIGKATADYRLDVKDSIRATGTVYGNSGVTAGNAATNGSIEIFHSTPFIDFHFGRSTADYTSRIIEEKSGRLAVIGTLRVSVGMYSDGYVSARGQNTSSDKRLKDIIGKVNLNVKQIANAPSVKFSWKADGTPDIGSIAQYWRNVSPLLTPKDLNGHLTLQYGKTALLSVISVAKKTINLEDRIKKLEKENKELKRKIKILERR